MASLCESCGCSASQGKLQVGPAQSVGCIAKQGQVSYKGPIASILLWSVLHVFRDISVNRESNYFIIIDLVLYLIR